MIKVLLLNDSASGSNWGGRAATVSLRMMIGQSGGHIVKTITIDDLHSPWLGEVAVPEATGRHCARERMKLFIPPVVLKVRGRLLTHARGSHDTPLIPTTWGDYARAAGRVLGGETPWPELLRSFREMDVAVIFGDGDIYGNGVLPRTLLFLSFLIKTHFGKPVIMVDHSADFEHPDLLRVAEEVYPLFDDVVFRDPVSAERCGSLCSGRFAADTAFWFKPASRKAWTAVSARPTYFDVWPDVAAFDPSEPYLCIGGSSIFGHEGVQGAIIGDYLLLIKHLQTLYSGQIVLTASDWCDQSIFRAIARQTGLPLISLAAPVQQAVDILGNADAYVGGRWHPSIFALRGGTPVLGLSAEGFKMRALTDMAGLPSATFDALGLHREAIAIGERLLSYLEQGLVLRNRLSSWADEMAERCWDNVAYLKKLRARTNASDNSAS